MTGLRIRAALIALAFCAPAALAQWADPNTPPVVTGNDLPPVADQPDSTAPVPPAEAAPVVTQHDIPPVADAPPQALPGSAAGPATPMVQPGTGIEVSTLGTVEGALAGTLDSTNGGLGEDLWSGSARAQAEELLSRLPLVSADPAIRDLARRIVLTKAPAPFGNAKRAFVTLRIEKLLDAGLTGEAGALAAQASVAGDADFARVQADALLIANRVGDVCGDLTTTRLSAGEPFWLELRAYCAAAGGDQPTADLTRSVMEAEGNTDKAYDTLLDDVLNRKQTPPGPIAHPTALHIFLLQQAGLPVTGDIAAVMGTPENLLAMRDARNSPRVRLDAAERIAATGAADIGELKTVADAQDIPLGGMANALADAPSLPFFSGQVLLRRAAQIETRPDAKAALVYEALSLGDKAGQLPLTAGLERDLAASIKPAPGPRAALFARALLLAGLPDAAARWLSPTDALRTVADFAAGRDAPAALAGFAATLVKNPPDPDPQRSTKALILGIADVLGRALPPDAKAEAGALEAGQWAGRRPDPALLRALENASLHPERKGEALLMILDAIRTIGLRDMAPDTTIECVRLLGAMGLPRAAHDIAMEALMLYVEPAP